MKALKVLAISVAAWSLPGCSPEPPAPRDAGTAVTSLAEVAGSWDVIQFGDYRPQRINESGMRMAWVTFGDDGVGSRMECNWYSGVNGEFDADGVFRDRPSRDGSIMSTLMLCPPEIDRREGQMMGYFRTDPRAEWIEDGMLALDNGKLRIVLQRPDEARLHNRVTAVQLEGEWHPTGVLRIDENGYSGVGTSEKVGFVEVSGDRIGLSACPNFNQRFKLGADGMFRLADPNAAAAALLECFGYSDRRATFLSLLEPAFAEHAGKGRIVLDADGLVLALQRADDWRRYMQDIESGIVRGEDGNIVQPPPASAPAPGVPPPPPAPPRSPPPPREAAT